MGSHRGQRSVGGAGMTSSSQSDTENLYIVIEMTDCVTYTASVSSMVMHCIYNACTWWESLGTRLTFTWQNICCDSSVLVQSMLNDKGSMQYYNLCKDVWQNTIEHVYTHVYNAAFNRQVHVLYIQVQYTYIHLFWITEIPMIKTS